MLNFFAVALGVDEAAFNLRQRGLMEDAAYVALLDGIVSEINRWVARLRSEEAI